MPNASIDRVRDITDRITMGLLGNNTFTLRVENDVKGGDRIFVQIVYKAPCTKTGEMLEWKGRKFYLSDHMIDNEIVFTVYLAYELTLRHEMMESFKVDGISLVNPHVDYRKLLEISSEEVAR